MANRENLTDNLRKAMVLATEVSASYNVKYIGSEQMVYAFSCLN